MNSVDLANRVWDWAKGCPTFPSMDSIVQRIALVGRECEPFVRRSATARVTERVTKFLEARTERERALLMGPIWPGPIAPQ